MIAHGGAKWVGYINNAINMLCCAVGAQAAKLGEATLTTVAGTFGWRTRPATL